MLRYVSGDAVYTCRGSASNSVLRRDGDSVGNIYPAHAANYSKPDFPSRSNGPLQIEAANKIRKGKLGQLECDFRQFNPSSINFSSRDRSASGKGADMTHPPKQDESQITTQGNPRDSGYRSDALIERDHRFIEKLNRPMQTFKSLNSASATLAGIEAAHMIRNSQLDQPEQSGFAQFAALAG